MNGEEQNSPFAALQDNPAYKQVQKYQRQYQILLDRSTPQTLYRWTATWVLLLFFVARIYFAEAYYIVTYALAIYLLNLFLAFLTPKFDPSLEQDLAEQDVEEGAPGLPTSSPNPGGRDDDKDEEFRPFIRRLPEFQFWLSATKAVAFSLLATLFPFFDIPVYAPILVIYFCILFAITMRRQISHMIRWKYVPFDLGRKTRYNKH